MIRGTAICACLLLLVAGGVTAAESSASVNTRGSAGGDGRGWAVYVSVPTEIINSFAVFSSGGERLQEAAPGPYSELGFGTVVEARVAGIGLIRGLWRPGAVLYSGYAQDTTRVSDPWSDVRLELGAPIAGPGRALWQWRDMAVTAGPRLTIPAPTIDYEEQSRLQTRKDVYIGSNQDLHAWALGLFTDAAWPVLGAAPIREGVEWRRRALRVAAGLRWDRFLPVDYATSGLEAYRVNAVRDLLRNVDPYERIDYRSRFQIDVTARTSWERDDVEVAAAGGVGGWWRVPPRVDDVRPVAGTGAGRVELQTKLEAVVPLVGKLSLGLSADGAVPLVGWNTSGESAVSVAVDMRIRRGFAGFASSPLKQ